jgi:BON domain
MKHSRSFPRTSGAAGARLTLALGLGLTGAATWVAAPALMAQQSGARSDQAIQSDVLKALASYPDVSSDHITAHTRDGVVTLTGTAGSETAKSQAQVVAATVDGVRSVVNDLQIVGGSEGTGAAVQQAQHNEQQPIQQAQSNTPDQPYTPPSQSSTPPQPGAQGNWGAAGPPPDVQNGQIPQQQTQGNADPAAGNQYPIQDPGQEDVPPPPQRPAYPSQQPPQQNRYPSQSPNNQYPQQGPYQQPYPTQSRTTYQPQLSATPLTIPQNTLISIRTSEPLDSRRLQGGETFQANLAQDIYQGPYLAIPRGAVLHGRVVNVKKPGALSGGAGFALQVVSLNLGGQEYPVVTDTFATDTHGKGGYTTANTIGVGAIGALIGAAAGGGPGAAIGAVAGGAAGLGVSAASGNPREVMPPETLLTFHLRAPITVNPVSYGEVQRLQASATPPRPQMVRRPPPYPYGYYPPPPPPPPYYYGAYYYPYPYYHYRYWR